MEKEFTEIIIEQTKHAITYFDIGFIMLYFFTNMILLKRTALSKKRKTWKQGFVLIYGVCLGLIYLKGYSYSHNTAEILKHTVRIGISIGATILFYDFIYKIIRNKIRVYVEIKKQIQNGGGK